MNAKDAIRSSANFSSMVLKTYISDLDDPDLMRRPGEGCNHLAWQLGHLISSEVSLLEGICPGKAAELPEGFSEAHSKEKAGSDDAGDFRTKAEYMELMEKVRASTLAALEELPDASLDDPSPESLRAFCPTVGHVFILIGTHPMMHAGQLVPIRRQLGKPVMF